MPLPPTYLPHLQTLLNPQPTMRGAEAPVPPADLLPESRAAGQAILRAWRDAGDDAARSRAEVQLLAAAAADLAVAQRLARGAQAAERGQEDVWPWIQAGLTDPDILLRPTLRPAAYRGADRDLLAAVYQTLNSIQDATTETVSDAITGALTLNFAVLREAVKLAGTDIRQLAEDLGLDEVAAFAGEAIMKLLALAGEDNLEHIQSVASETWEKLQEKTAVSTYVQNFLDAEGIYREGRAWIQAYEGPDRNLARLTPRILAVQGSFSGRNKLAAALIRLLALVKLAPALKKPPWGPLITASGYALIIGYELYSAHDHVDSDRFPFFDRVEGVRTLLISRLAQ